MGLIRVHPRSSVVRGFLLESVRSGLQKIAADLLRSAPAEDAPLLAWPVASGARIAERTRALEFADGVLRVEVPDATWRNQLADLAPRYVATIRQLLGERVSRIEFVVSATAETKRAR